MQPDGKGDNAEKKEDGGRQSRAVAMLGRAKDPRAAAALEHLEKLRRPDGTWRATGRRYWTKTTEAVEWGDASAVITAAAERIRPMSRYVATRGPSNL